MQVTLAYGKTGVAVNVPDDATILEPRYAPEVPDADAALAEAIARPIGCASLSELAAGKATAAISVCDITRPAPNRLVLPHVLRALEAGGIPREGVQILIATGLHREATAGELDEILGPEIVRDYAVDSHRARNLDEQTDLGVTPGGTHAYVDKRFVEADLHITLGFIEPHLMAGFSGGRKLISIGLAGERTIKRLHSPTYMRDARAVEGCFPDNPLHRELIEIARRAGHDFMVDVALNRERGITAVFAGEPEAAHARGVDFVRGATRAEVEEPADLVITTCGGYPLDLTYYQAVKGVTAAAHVVREGGTILVVAECAEGLGSPEFADLVRRSPDPKALMDEFLRSDVRIDQWQCEKLAMVLEKARVAFCVPGVAPEDRTTFWGPTFDRPQEAVDALTAEAGGGARITVIPEGPYVFAQAAEEPVLA